jgi:predicted nuclease of restriction endonuclease-like (RecB) superfamily
VTKKAIRKSLTLSFDHVISSIIQADRELGLQAARAVNVSLTLRNWLIGFYIAEYELGGADRAQYGEKLLERLSERLITAGISRTEPRELRRYKLFYSVYPAIAQVFNAELKDRLKLAEPIRESVTPESTTSIRQLVNQLSFTHFVELLSLESSAKRSFYEQQCLQGHWSVRELKRQISSLLFERIALSKNKRKTLDLAGKNADQATKLEIRDPYVFEFLGIKPNETVTEIALEHAILDKIQNFILELGNGFCFEARQKRILIGYDTFFVDLVFYHRILRCHVLIELKIGKFTHEHIGQLNTYVTWYKRHMMTEHDNPPVGVLLCNQKNEALVEYALAGMDNDLFVSKYLLELPSQDVLQQFLKELQEGS